MNITININDVVYENIKKKTHGLFTVEEYIERLIDKYENSSINTVSNKNNSKNKENMNYFKELMKEFNILQKDLADYYGVTETTISRTLLGKNPSLKLEKKILQDNDLEKTILNILKYKFQHYEEDTELYDDLDEEKYYIANAIYIEVYENYHKYAYSKHLNFSRKIFLEKFNSIRDEINNIKQPETAVEFRNIIYNLSDKLFK